MELFKDLDKTEIAFIAAFFVFYIIYFARIALVSKGFKISYKGIIFKFVLRSIYFFLILIALLGPTFGGIKKEIKAVSKDVYIILDLSASINAQDILPSRVVKAKKELETLVSQSPSDRFSLIVFSDKAFVHCPLTQDGDAFIQFLHSANTSILPGSGSNLADAIDVTTKLLAAEKTKDNTQVCLLVSDGEDFSESAYSKLGYFKKNKIDFFALGVGTTEGSKIPSNSTSLKDSEGNIIVSRLNEEHLMEVCERANGKFFKINKKLSQANQMRQHIHNIKGKPKDMKKHNSLDNKFYYFLLLALGFIIIDILVGVHIIKIS
jgi:Ca-activated chloride channel family protein